MLKRIFIAGLISLSLVFSFSPSNVSAASKFFGATSLIGGGAGALDAIDGAGLTDGDAAYVVTTSNVFYVYLLDADSAAAESSPDIISPDTNAGDKRWLLSSIKAAALTEGANAVPNATDNLSFFAATTSAQLRAALTDESGTGAALFAGGNIGAATGTSLDLSGALEADGNISFNGGSFVDESGNALVPVTITWTLSGSAGNVINSRQAVSIAVPAASVDIVLSGNDLAITGVTNKRVLTVNATYNSDYGIGLPLKGRAAFTVEDLVGVL